MEVKADVLFEASWEVCNKVGGIYTVVSSKAALVQEKYKNYFLIGPYFEEKAREDLVKENPPKEFQPVFNELEQEGIICHYGSWQIKGNPNAILIDFKGFANKKNEIKTGLWNDYKIDSLNSRWDFEEPMLWAIAAGKLIEKFCLHNNKGNKKKIAAQFHEWMAGFALLYLKKQNIKVGTVFTTHATMLGRSIAGSGSPLYDMLERMDPDKEAHNYWVQDKHLTEKACASVADVFTTVSEITSIEAEKILGKGADILLLNGLDIEKFPTYETCALKHRENRETVREFLAYYFFPHYYFDLEQSLTFFIVGRYEFKNKGIDILLKALAKLNDKMKEEKSKKTVIVFFWIPREVHGAKTELSLNKINYYQMRNFVGKNSSEFQKKIMNTVMKLEPEAFEKEENVHEKGFFSLDFLKEAKKLKINFEKKGNPLIVTHNLPDEQHDAIIRACLDTGLDNKEDDKVKVIFYPVYLTGVDGLVDLPYYEAITGCHLGLFPSYYEPWGYTPLESAAFGVTSLTTDLGGFGRFLMEKGTYDTGVYVLKRFGVSEDETVEHFTNLLLNYVKLDEKGRVREKIMAKELSSLADWKELIQNYFEAHNLAVQRVWG